MPESRFFLIIPLQRQKPPTVICLFHAAASIMHRHTSRDAAAGSAAPAVNFIKLPPNKTPYFGHPSPFSINPLTSYSRHGILTEMHRKGAIYVTAATKSNRLNGGAFFSCVIGVSCGSGVFFPVADTCFPYFNTRLR